MEDHQHFSYAPFLLSSGERSVGPDNAETGCAVKGAGPQRELDPPGNWFAPPGSNQSSSGGNETAEASGVESR